ncbi:MAG TPA: Sec-independent protein translocase protein TatB [Dongiaceae bacterium]
MFDLGWDEMALIAVVALVVLGPKELPNALRTVSGLMKQARKLAGEFQSGVHEIIREAELEDAKKVITDLNKGSISGAIEKHLDADGEIKSALQKPTDETVNPAAIAETPAQEQLPSAAEADINPAVAAFAPGGSAHQLPAVEDGAALAGEMPLPAVEGDLKSTPIEDGPDDELRAAAVSSVSTPSPSESEWGAKLVSPDVSDKSNRETEKSKIS